MARKRDPDVLRVRAELSRIKLESYVGTLHTDMQR